MQDEENSLNDEASLSLEEKKEALKEKIEAIIAFKENNGNSLRSYDTITLKNIRTLIQEDRHSARFAHLVHIGSSLGLEINGLSLKVFYDFKDFNRDLQYSKITRDHFLAFQDVAENEAKQEAIVWLAMHDMAPSEENLGALSHCKGNLESIPSVVTCREVERWVKIKRVVSEQALSLAKQELQAMEEGLQRYSAYVGPLAFAIERTMQH